MKSVTFFLLVASLFVVTIAQENSEEVKCEIDKRTMIDYVHNMMGLGAIDESLRNKLWDMDMGELYDLMFEGLRKLIKIRPDLAEKAKLSIKYFEEQKEICGH